VSNRTYRIGTRKSALALWQSEHVASLLAAKGIRTELIPIDSRGDKDRATPLYRFEPGSPGLFTKHLEEALLRNEIDLAVHSLKDLPTRQPAPLRVACVPPRESDGDCLLIHRDRVDDKKPLKLSERARVGTSSLRREAQMLAVRADVEISPLRGNVPTRVAAVREGKVDAAILAHAGLKRLALDLSDLEVIFLDGETFVAAPGQGALAIETRTDLDADLFHALRGLNDPAAESETRIERRVLSELEGGCTLPLGVNCHFDPKTSLYRLRAFLGVPVEGTTGPRQWKGFHRFDISEAREETLVTETVRYFKERT